MSPRPSKIHSVRHSLPRHALLILIRAPVISKVDYCNSVLASMSGRIVIRLQSILNAAAWLVFSVRRSEPITPLLKLRWLRVSERIQVRLCVLVYRCLQGTAPPYFAESFHRITEVTARCRLRSADTSSLLVSSTRRESLGNCALSVAAPRLWNTLFCRLLFELLRLCRFCWRELKTLLFQLSFN